VATAAARIERLTTPQPLAPVFRETPVAVAELSFTDRADGSVAVSDSGDGRPIATLLPGQDGFVRSVLRGLAHDRIRHHIGASAPFRLSEIDHGQLFLVDTATNRVIDLQAFGPDNRDAFRRFLRPAGAVS